MKIDFIGDINEGYADALNYPATDRFMVQALWWHFAVLSILVFLTAGLKLASIYPSPLSWRVITIPEAVGAMMLAFAATIVPVLLVNVLNNHYAWRVIITVALTVYSYLFVFVSGGSIEMHFHFFIVIALLVIYVDWRLGWILLILTGLHHGILNYVEPGWVYFYGRNDFAVIAHSIPVLFAVICTTVLCEIGRKSVINLKENERKLQEYTHELETRSTALQTERDNAQQELRHTSKVLAERDTHVQKLKEEVKKLTPHIG